jgi:septum formation protein
MLKIVLASASPRRKKLLRQIGFIFEIMPSSLENEHSEQTTPALFAEDIAHQKAKDVAKRVKNALIIGADTIVTMDDEILGKPSDEQDAYRMLKLLSGNKHTVITAVSLLITDDHGTITQSKTFHVATDVWFSELNDNEILNYIASGSPMDKAGAYGIQDDKGSVFVERIEGDFYNVVGFPVNRFYNELKQVEPSLADV